MLYTGSQSRRPPPVGMVLILGAIGWLLLNDAIIAISQGYLPFDRPNLRGTSFALQIAMPSIAMLEQFALMGLVGLLTRHRTVSDFVAKSRSRSTAIREVVLVLAYAVLAQAGGWIVGPSFGFRPFSFHLAGTLVGCSTLASPAEAVVWATYNFLAFAVIPYVWFRRRYSNRELFLVFDRKRGDFVVLLVVLAVESTVQLAAMPGIFMLPTSVLLRAAPLSFVLFLFGTVLPAMITIYAILLPRYYRLTGSVAISVVLGGLTYASMHIVEGWSTFSTPRSAILSVLFVFLSYTGPGMFKSFVTIRTRNAWVHALGYHAIAPHTLIDAPMIAKVFRLG